MTSRNTKTLASFTKYCEEHPELRFAQALAAFLNVPYIGQASSHTGEGFEDLFFDEFEDKATWI